jgi:hypothetical protein
MKPRCGSSHYRSGDNASGLLRCTFHFRVGSIASLLRCPSCVRFPPDRDQIADVAALRFWATAGLMHRNISSEATGYITASMISRKDRALINGLFARPPLV